MTRLAFLIIAASLGTAVPSAEEPGGTAAIALSPPAPLALRAPEVWREGSEIVLHLEASDPSIVSVSVYLTAQRTPVGGRSRGSLTEVLLPPARVGMSIEQPNVALLQHTLKVPYFDAVGLRLFAKGFDAAGTVVARAKMPVVFVPAAVPEDMADGVVVSKSRQRLFALKEGVLRAAYVVSTGRRHRDGGGPTPSMVSTIHNKARVARSHRYEVDMRYWNAITSDGRYGIHATWPSEYRKLGRAESHGCVRLHYADAREFYQMAPVGWPVVVTN